MAAQQVPPPAGGSRIVVVGATGNVGTSVVQALADDPDVDSIVGVARRLPEWTAPRTRWMQADIAEDDLVELFRGADAVIHLAWLFQPTHDRITTWRNNALGGPRVFDAVAAAGVPALVCASSVGAYSPGPKDRTVDESWPTDGWPGAAYTIEKAYLERVLDAFEPAMTPTPPRARQSKERQMSDPDRAASALPAWIRPPTNRTEEVIAMTTAREIMTPSPTCIRASETVLDAATRMAELDVGALPICGEDNRLKGMLTDRDIVVKVLANGKDPMAVHAGELAQGEAVTIGADDDAREILRTMSRHKVRRLPVIDGHDMVGIVAFADVARALPDAPVGELLEAVSTD